MVIETLVQPNGFVAFAHVHPFQSERFAVSTGTLGLKIGRERLTLESGDIATVEPGTAHRFWNGGESPVRFVCDIRPALQFESLLETMFALAADGKTGRKGMPAPFLACCDRAGPLRHRPAAFPTRVGAEGRPVALGAPLGRLAGYEPSYRADPASSGAVPLLGSE